MNCPRCQRELPAAPVAGVTVCPDCGASIPPQVPSEPPIIPVPPPLPMARPVGSSVKSLFAILGVVAALSLGFVVLLVAIAYAGCTYIMKNFN